MKIQTIVLLGFISMTQFLLALEHEKREFIEKLSDSMKTLEEGFTKKSEQKTVSGKLLESLINSFLKENILKKDNPLTSIDKFEDLKKQLLKAKATKELGSNIISAGDIQKMLENDFQNIPEEEKDGVRNKLISLLLTEAKKTGKKDVALKDKLERVVLDYLKAAKKLDANVPVILSDSNLKELGLSKDSAAEELLPKKLIKKIKKQGFSSEEAALSVLSNLVNNSLKNVESLDNSFEPINKELYQSIAKTTPNRMAKPESFEEALNKVNEFRAEILKQLEAANPADLSQQLNLSPIQGHKKIFGNSGGSRFNGNGVSGGTSPSTRTIPGAFGSVPEFEDSKGLRDCLNDVKKKRFNIELQLPGSLCASTAVSANPKGEIESFSKKKAFEQCPVKLATAVHCIEGMNLNGYTIGAKIDGMSIASRVLSSGSLDKVNGEAVANGNPDLGMIVVSMPCGEAKKIHMAKVPTESEMNDMIGRESLPFIMQQNSDINASVGGENAATIAAVGRFEKYSDETLGNFLRFNSNNDTLNKSIQNRGDSKRIKQGDSGGTALACKMAGGDIVDYLYLGAISHVEVRGDASEGTIGGVASGQSLANLSKLLHGVTDRSLAKHDNEPKDVVSSSPTRQNTATKALFHF